MQRSPELENFARIRVVGVGGGGSNAINRMIEAGVSGVDFIAVNTDSQALLLSESPTRVHIGEKSTRGLGAGGDPEKGEKAAAESMEELVEVLKGSDMVFVTAGMGGGTGTGAAPVVSKIAKEQGAIVVGMVSTPFNVERARTVKAEEGLERLRNEADSIIVLDNNRLLEYVPNLPIGKAFSVMDQIIAETVKGISETITQPSLINLDYADMTAIMDSGGVAVMLVGETQDKNKSEEVVKDAMNHPLLDVDYRGASGGLVHITGGPDLTLKEAEGIAENITERLDASANVIWGARIQEEYKGKVRVMAIMTGVQSAQVLGPAGQDATQYGAGNDDRQPFGAQSDGGRSELEQETGLDVIR
jgi:cell division protein FtsZ